HSIRKLVNTFDKRGHRPLPRTLARQLLMPHREQTLETWLEALPGKTLAAEIGALIEPDSEPLPQRRGAKVPDSLTYRRSATRAFEVNYWKAIAELGEGTFLNKNNADCMCDTVTRALLPYLERQLEDLGDYLLGYYARKIEAAGMTG